MLLEPLTVLYPKILSSPTIECDCADVPCVSVYWFRSISNNSKMEFIGLGNHADRIKLGDGVDERRFKFIIKSKNLFALQIINLTKEDTGTYSCVLKKRSDETWKPGILLLPGGLLAKISSASFTVLKSNEISGGPEGFSVQIQVEEEICKGRNANQYHISAFKSAAL